MKRMGVIFCAAMLLLCMLMPAAWADAANAGEANAKARYYALCIGEKTHVKGVWDSDLGYVDCNLDLCYRNRDSAAAMGKMLKGVAGPSGNKFTTTVKIDQTYAQIRKLIQKTFKKAKKNDVCLFYIATHGFTNGDGELFMPYRGREHNVSDLKKYYAGKYLLPFDTLAAWLKESCAGKVIVLIEACGSGSAIYAKKNAAGEGGSVLLDNEMSESVANASGKLILNAPGPETGYDAEQFVNRAVRAFERADEPVVLEEEMVSNQGVGAMRVKNKFYVLTAAKRFEESWGVEFWRGSKHWGDTVFTRFFIQGVGSKKNGSPADRSPKNKIITLKEMYNYLRKFIKVTDYRLSEPFTSIQHYRVYPENSSFEMFSIK